MMGKGGDDGPRTVECLRGRLLAERAASKAAKAEAELMAKRLAELERQLAEEVKWRNRAEKRMKYALRKLESLKLSDASGQSNLSRSSESSSSSSACFSGHQRSEGREPNSVTVDSGQCGSGKEVGEMLDHLGLEDFIGDDGSGDSSADSPLQVVSQEGSWSSVGTAHSGSKGAPRRDETNKSLNPQELITDDVRETLVSSSKPVGMKHQTELTDNTLAIVPVSLRPSPASYKPEINSNVHSVLVTLRHVREQLQESMGRRAAACSHKELCGL